MDMSVNREMKPGISPEMSADAKDMSIGRMEETIYQLDMDGARLEQCAFDSINTTDQVMLRLNEAMQQMDLILATQAQLQAGMEFCTMELGKEEADALLTRSGEQAKQLEALLHQLHQAAEAGVEANDAARCIEAAVVDQSEHIGALVGGLEGIEGFQS